MRKFLAAISLFLILLPTSAGAQITVDSTGLTATGDKVYGDNYLDAEERRDIGTYIGTTILTPLFGLLGVIFLILIIYAGLLWMTSSGVEAQVTKAKHILVNSTIGLVIIILSYAITTFIFAQLA